LNDEDRLPTVDVGDRVLALARGDITRFSADVIVNAANSALAGGGGVDGAIHRAGGPEIMSELRSRYDGCPTGRAVLTGAGSLPARWVVHAVGPVWRGGANDEPSLLASAYREALRLATELGAQTIAFPAISCGIYGYPVPEAARVALDTVVEHLDEHSSVQRATFVLYSNETYEQFRSALAGLKGRGNVRVEG
jgi:O-acetyl-ADP-ribose deacetylase (regulator of RNase III)